MPVFPTSQLRGVKKSKIFMTKYPVFCVRFQQHCTGYRFDGIFQPGFLVLKNHISFYIEATVMVKYSACG